jgi:lipopolysaccharide/colanic/teichoic acid biosynthesis glycosyltransferase
MRGVDILLAFVGIVFLAPFFVLIALLVKVGSQGPVLYIQWRVGKHGVPFRLFKFRTMHVAADKKGLLTIGGKDTRVTGIGYFLRKYKLDELPQLLNVLRGDMSIVGPRPEVQKYVDLYNADQRRVLSVRPGITDQASITFRNESELLAQVADPEGYYVSEIMPRKIELNYLYIQNQSLKEYFRIIFRTLATSVKGK